MSDLPHGAGERAWTADRWSALLDRAGVGYTTGESAAKAKKSIPAGRWLNGRLRRPVPITVGGRPAVAELRAVDGRAKAKRYVLLVRYTDQDSTPDRSPVAPVTVRSGPVPSAVPPTAPPTMTPGANAEDW